MDKSKEKKELALLIESLYRLEKKLSKTILTLKLERDTHVPDLMTRIRILVSVAVVAQKDKEGLVKPKAYVVLNSESNASTSLEDELKEYVKQSLAPYKYPRWVEFVAELPKTATGKIQRFKLRELVKTS